MVEKWNMFFLEIWDTEKKQSTLQATYETSRKVLEKFTFSCLM